MDLYANGLLTLTATGSSGTTAPAAGIVETWTVAALGATFPTLGIGQSARLIDQYAPGEIIQVTQMSPSATSIQVIRGVEGTTPVAHATGASFNVFEWTNASQVNQAGGSLIDSATTWIGTAAGLTSSNSWLPIPGCMVIVPPGVPYSLDLDMQMFHLPGNATVGQGLHFSARIWNSAGVAVNTFAPSGQGGQFVGGHDEYYVVPVVGQVAQRTHRQHWELPPLAASDVYSVYMQSTNIGSPTASSACSCPAPGSFVGGPTVLTARRL